MMPTKYTLQGVCRPELYAGIKNIHVFEMLDRLPEMISIPF